MQHVQGWQHSWLWQLPGRSVLYSPSYNRAFLHDRPRISPWIKSISNELDITYHVFASQLSGHCDVIANQLWRHHQNIKRASETWGWCVKILVLASFMDSLCRVRNKIMYVLLWRTVYALTRVLFWCLFPSLLRNSGNKNQITLSWAHKQFATRVHTLFSIHSNRSCFPGAVGCATHTAATNIPIVHHVTPVSVNGARTCAVHANLASQWGPATARQVSVTVDSACRLGGHYWDFSPGTLSYRQVTAYPGPGVQHWWHIETKWCNMLNVH